VRHAREQRERHFKPLAGCLLGTAIGDALGLPAEGLSPARQARLFPDFERHRLLPFGCGMCSDDTEHTIMVAQSLVETAGHARADENADAFRRKLACRLRWWLLGLPAGIGMATLRSIVKLWLFLPRRWQGTYSAGNAPAMRSALLGVFWDEKPALLRAHVAASTRLTHTDPRAEQAALAVALAAMHAAGGVRVDPAHYAEQIRNELGTDGTELAALVDRVTQSVAAGESTSLFAQSLGLGKGVTGYALHTVPVALHAWLAHQHDYRAAVLAVIRCGGDTDTSAAITGAIVGAGTGVDGIPLAWRVGLAEWPHDVAWLLALANTLADVRVHYVGTTAPAAAAAKLMARNLGFIVIVLAHGFRRLLPPY
jgi:ADP-ribosylglycohydrolase